MTCSKAAIAQLFSTELNIATGVETGALSISGDQSAVTVIFDNLDTFARGFGIIEP